MAKAKRAKKPESILVKRTELPKLPFTMCDRGNYIRRPTVAVAKLGKDFLHCLTYTFAEGLVTVMAVHRQDIDFAHVGKKLLYVDGDHIMGGPSHLAKTHLGWLKAQALRAGATQDAILLLKEAVGLTKNEEGQMAKAATKIKETKTKPVGKGGKVAAAKGGKGKGNPEALEKARAAAAARNEATRALKITVKVTKKDTQAEDFKLRGGRLAKLLYVIENKPKTVGDVVGNTVKDDEGNEHKLDMSALRGMEKRGHITIG